MKVVFITGSVTAMPLLQWLMQRQLLHGLLLQNELYQAVPALSIQAAQANIACLSINKVQLKQHDTAQWLKGLQADVVLVFGFSYILPKQLLTLPIHGCFNIHFSMLPAYKGPAPIFWQLKLGEKNTGVSIHKMSEQADEGEVILQQQLLLPKGITNNAANWFLANAAMQAVALFFMQNSYKKINNSNTISGNQPSSYYSKPSPKDYTIQWATYTALDIENLANATNQIYGGAICYYQQQEVRIVQAKAIENKNDLKPHTSGGIAYTSSPEGLIVIAAKKTWLQVEILSTAMGILSAAKWVQLNNVKPNTFFS
jgi:methionyl-tRNA formyltransferase